MTPIPRAIAPLVTTITSSPAWWRSLSSSQIRASTSSRTTAVVVGDDARPELDDEGAHRREVTGMTP